MTEGMHNAGGARPVIYQLFVRLFGNTNETRKPHGTLAENGVGKFADIDGTALDSLKTMGISHVWLTGVIEQASGTGYPDRPADDPAILKGLAGSPYAIRDYFDVCPDYAVDPARRIEEFRELVIRCHERDLRVIIDFIPNHVARSYASDVHPHLSFGSGDNPGVFFDRENHFYYLGKDSPGGGPPLVLPVAEDHCYEPEAVSGKVTGNNGITWRPSIHDWYETVKINYGHDFTKGRATGHLPGPDAAVAEVPRTWRTMDEILAYWQELGVDGFRADMAHMVPMDFWHWAVKRARSRDSQVYFSAEAYDTDPAKLTDGNVLDALLDAGFNAVYDKKIYDVAEGIYETGKWANDLDAFQFNTGFFHRALRFVENHDEVRVACPEVWGGHGMKVGKPASAALFGTSRGSIMLYSGQEIGEAGGDEAGFSSDHKRTTIFDYWTMPEFVKWVNGGKFDGGRLSQAQRDLRTWYGDLLRVVANPAFTEGEFYGLNYFNRNNPAFGRLDGEQASGHWLYAFLRHDPASGQSFLVAVNFHPDQSIEAAKVIIPAGAWEFMGLSENAMWKFTDHLASDWVGEERRDDLDKTGMSLPVLPPCSALMLEILPM